MFGETDPGRIREREDHAATQGFFGGLILGILIGVVLALIFAPRRGDETRAAVVGKATEVTHKAANLIDRGSVIAKSGAFSSEDQAAIEREIGGEDTVKVD